MPTWVSEASSAKFRGSLVLLGGAAAIFGEMVVGWLELGFSYAPTQVSFRFPIAFQATSPLIQLLLMAKLVESPRWLMAKSRSTEAEEVMRLLEPNDEAVRTSLAEMQAAIQQEEKGSGGPFARNAERHWNRTCIAIGINILAQMSGVNVISFYSNLTLTQSLKYDELTARIISNCLQTWQFLMASTAVFLIDRFGRRQLLMTGAVFMAIANAGLTGLQSMPNNEAAAAASLLFYFIALAAFPIGLFLIPFLYAAEISPLPIRAEVAAMSAGECPCKTEVRADSIRD